MSGFLSWFKSNIILVILGILTVVPLPVAWYFSTGMNAKLRESRQEEAQKALRDVQNAKVTYSLPALSNTEEPVSDNGPPNAAKTAFYKAELEKRLSAIEQIKQRAVSFNEKDHHVLLEGLFPMPESPAAGQILRPEMASIVLAHGPEDEPSAYDKLFKRLRIRPPLDPVQLAEQLAARKSALMDQLAPGTAESALDEATRAQIEQQLVEERLARYETHARDTSIYGDDSILPAVVPRVVPSIDPSIETCFEWQMDYWLIEDLLSAMVEANNMFDATGVGGNVLVGPVKRIESIEFAPMFVGVQSAAAESQNIFEGSADAQARELARSRNAERGGFAGAGGGPVPSGTFTGRESEKSELYDVRVATVTMIVSYEKLPALINAISGYNFMTVLDADLYAVDQWEQIEQGYYAGGDFPVRVEMQIETLWLRNWTKQYMPPSIRTQLGIPDDLPTDGPA